ncbi:acyltransferase [Rhodocytophaga rosea]|uniref:Acyltransferase n=1 Tax=Rhodocytophaga rosea TaxID=2704465 RepID=A0A6C0GPK6_9BACT|nr:acyltransferase [Rhodocytophaga rosea]QHT69986.1 acyltransferase [Rhodocytophaga rosea]
MQNTIGQLDKSRNNNFDLIRFVAASLVVFSHSFLIYKASKEEVFRKAVGFMSLGSLSVYVFFLISGYLITKSLIRQDSLGRFIWARALRIFPALGIAVIFCVFVIGPLCTNLPLTDYFSQSSTYDFLWRNVTLLNPLPFLPGVFEQNPYPRFVNSPLWTLRAELLMYLVVFFGGVLLLVFKKDYTRLRKSAFLIIGVIAYLIGMQLNEYYLFYYAPPWILFFVVGAVCYFLRDKIKISIKYALLMWVIIAACIFFKIPGYKYTLLMGIPYTVFVLAYHPRLLIKNFSKYGDFSYGIYIYAFPIQQALVIKVPGLNIYTNFAISYILVFILAVLSWHFIEKRALQLKNMNWNMRSSVLAKN